MAHDRLGALLVDISRSSTLTPSLLVKWDEIVSFFEAWKALYELTCGAPRAYDVDAIAELLLLCKFGPRKAATTVVPNLNPRALDIEPSSPKVWQPKKSGFWGKPIDEKAAQIRAERELKKIIDRFGAVGDEFADNLLSDLKIELLMLKAWFGLFSKRRGCVLASHVDQVVDAVLHFQQSIADAVEAMSKHCWERAEC